VQSGESLRNYMKQPKLTELTLDTRGTKLLRAEAAKSKKIKITINIDQDSLYLLKRMADKTGAPYQKLLNQILKEGLKNDDRSESRLDRIEKELEKLKKKVA